MKVGVLVFPGSNCDHDCYRVVDEILGQPVDYIWHRARSLGDRDLIIIPGGFSYGDYLRAGAIARFSPVMEAVARFAEQGGLVLGICNGFQILMEAGLLPGAMLSNASLHFVCRHMILKVENNSIPFTQTYSPGELLNIPIAHHEGNFFVEPETLQELEENNQIVFRYVDRQGRPTAEANPNGAISNIAGVCNRVGNVLGLMPHPERAAEKLLGSTDGLGIFLGAVRWLEGNGAA